MRSVSISCENTRKRGIAGIPDTIRLVEDLAGLSNVTIEGCFPYLLLLISDAVVPTKSDTLACLTNCA